VKNWWQEAMYHPVLDAPDVIREASAHHGVRNQRCKSIYWYYEGVDIEGTRGGGQHKEWELFDTKEDPLEIIQRLQRTQVPIWNGT
jgi:hypothetical protein